MKLIVAFAAILSVVFSATVRAEVDDVRCLQAQLTQAGYDPGPIDGLMGPGTAEALDSFLEELGLTLERPVHSENAVVQCRRIGLAQPDLAAFWPSRDEELVIEIDPAVSSSVRRVVSTLAPGIHREAFARLDLSFAGTDVLVVATTAEQLRILIENNTGFLINDLSDTLTEACSSSTRGISGAAAPGIVYLCVPPDATIGYGVELDWLKFLLARNFSYLVQYQISGAASPDASDQAKINAEGPAWLVHGYAQMFANVVATGAPEWDYRNIMVSRFDGAPLPELGALESRRDLAQNAASVYRTGAIAVIDLHELHGDGAFGLFFEELGAGTPFKQAFENTFGVSVDQFYEEFVSRQRP